MSAGRNLLEDDPAAIENAIVERGQSRHVVLKGRRLHYLEWGYPCAPSIVFLHGGGLTARTWDDVCEMMQADFRCISVDLRGHGDSEWSYEFEYEIADYVSDLERLVDALQLGWFVLVGMSLGGIVALTYAIEHANRIAGLASVDVIPGAETGEAFRFARYFYDLEKVVESASSLKQVVSWALDRTPHKQAHALQRMLARNIRELPTGKLMLKRDTRHRYRIESTIAALQAIPKSVAQITCPVLVVKGGRSRAFSSDAATGFAASLPRGRSVVIDGAGHAVQEEEPAALVAALQQFMADIGAPYGEANIFPD